MTHFSVTSLHCPVYLRAARQDILKWITTDTPDVDKCYNLFREMELVDDDGQYRYDEIAESTEVVDVEDGEKEGQFLEPEIHMAIEGVAVEEQASKRKQIWGAVQGTRQSACFPGACRQDCDGAGAGEQEEEK